jgi:predicted nucleotidyltransferase
MLERLFSSRVRVKLLTIFMTNPLTRFYTRQLERLLEESPYAIQRELRRLEGIGLLQAEREANLRYYWVNREFPIYPELKGIILKTSGLGNTLREALSQLGTVEEAFIYGSVAEGDEDGFSDVDLMIIGKVDLLRLAETVAGIEDLIGREVNYIAYEKKELDDRVGEGDPFLTNVQSGPRITLIGSGDESGRTGAVA